jgi:hypothetical protein
MPVEQMLTAQSDYSIGQERAYGFTLDLEAVGFSKWVILPELSKTISVTISFSGGASGKVQHSTDQIKDIKNGNAIPIDWPWGEGSTNQSHSVRPVTALRLVQTSAGTCKLTLRSQ